MTKVADAIPPAPAATAARAPVVFVTGGIFALLAVVGVAASGQTVWRPHATPQRTINLRWPAEAPEALEKMEREMGAWVLSLPLVTLSISSEPAVQPPDQYEGPASPQAHPLAVDIVPLPRARAVTPRSPRAETKAVAPPQPN
jgi:hypothetical protein